MDIKEVLNKAGEIIESYSNTFSNTAKLLETYFTGGNFSLYDAKLVGEACALREKSEDFEFILFSYMKTGCDMVIVENLAQSIKIFFDVAGRYVEFGDEYSRFDLPTIFDSLFVEMLNENLSLIGRRLSKIEKDRDWLSENTSVIAMKNNNKYPFDEIEDAEHEHEFRVSRIFNTAEHIKSIADFITDYTEAQKQCWKFGLHSLVELGCIIEERIERYSSTLSPEEYVKEKYRKAREAGEFIIGSDYELRDWECTNIKLKEEIDTMVSESTIEEEVTPNQTLIGSTEPRREYFSWQKVNHIHEICNGNQFHDVSIGELYSIINLHDCTKILVYQAGELERVCHLIHMLEKSMTKSDGRLWRTSICGHLKIDPRTYNKNYKKVSSAISRFHQEFEGKVAEMLKKFEDIDEAA